MTVLTTIAKAGPYAGADTTGPFTVPFRFLDAAHLRVIRSVGNVETVLVLGTDYTVSGVGATSGTVTLVAPLPVGQTLTVVRNVPATQEADYVPGDSFPAESHEGALDKLTMITQQLQEEVQRAAKLPASSPSDADALSVALLRVDANSSNINAVNANSANINAAVANSANINTVAANVTDVTNFAGVYLGARSADPATRTNGSPLQAGDLYFNTAANQMRGYSGSGWTITAPATDANLVSYLPSGTGAVATNVQSKLRESVSVWDFMTDAQKADVAAGTALVDTLDAFYRAINSFPNTFDNIHYRQGGTVLVPFGKYYLSDTLVLDSNIVLKGVGAPYGNAEGGSILVFADNRDGILCVDHRASPSNKQGTGLVIEGLYLTRKNTGGSVGSGISLKTTARIINTTCFMFREHGIKIDASTDYIPASNANKWEIRSCTVAHNGLHGLYVEGADANAGAAYNVNAMSNGGWGIYDSSFLGNTYVACHSDANGLGAYNSDSPTARNIFVGCYSESGQPPASIAVPSMIVGGLHAAGYGTHDPAIDVSADGLVSNSRFGTGSMRIGVGQANTSGVGLTYRDTGGTWGWTFSKAVGRWGYQWANLGSPHYLMFYDRTATPANGYPRDLSSANGALGISEHYFGAASQMRFRGLGSEAPASGAHIQGDIIWNISPTAGGFIGWVCTASGTPGTWRTFGAISV